MKRRVFLRTLPVMAGYLFLGVAFGVALKGKGYGWPWALYMSGCIYAGSMQFALLEALLHAPQKIFTRQMLMDELWGYDSESDPRTVDTHIRRLREKLAAVPDFEIQTVRGLGYRAVVK